MGFLPENTLEMPDQRALHCRLCGPEDAERVVVIVHGLGEHIGWYSEFIETAAERGVATLAYDQHGHGKSPGRRGHAPGLQTLIDDIDVAVARAADRWPDAEPLLLGHSLGGHLVLRYLVDRRRPIERAMLTNPMILPADPPTKPQAFAAWLTSKCVPRIRMSADIEPQELTRDDDVIEELADDPLNHDQLSIGIGGALMSSGYEILERCESIDARLLVLLGSEDAFCDRESTEQVIRRLHRCEKVVFEGFRHNLLLETSRQDVYNQLLRWIS
jgi:alpha-beta hydrolase superfamily lysophospholipase